MKRLQICNSGRGKRATSVRRWVVTISIIGLATSTAIAALALRTNSPTAAPRVAESATVLPPQGPTEQDVSEEHTIYDIDLAKKFILYHELAAQLDRHALANTGNPDIREFAAQQQEYNTREVAGYAAVLRSWNEPFSRLEDYPKIPGSSCGTYPTFPGMLPHADTTTFLDMTGDTIDRTYLQLLAQQRTDILTTISANEEFANYKPLSDLRKTFLITRRESMQQIAELQ